MINKRIVLTGGTGFIDQEMIKYFGKENKIVILSGKLSHGSNNRNYYNALSQEDLKNVQFCKMGDGKTSGIPPKILESGFNFKYSFLQGCVYRYYQ